MKSWTVTKRFDGSPTSLKRIGNFLNKNSGMGINDSPTFTSRKNCSLTFNRFLNFSSFRWKRWPPRTAHRTLTTEGVKTPLKSTIPSEFDAAVVRISSNSWWISSSIKFSDDVRPKPKSRRWRSVKRRCSCQKSPSTNKTPNQLCRINFNKINSQGLHSPWTFLKIKNWYRVSHWMNGLSLEHCRVFLRDRGCAKPLALLRNRTRICNSDLVPNRKQ